MRWAAAGATPRAEAAVHTRCVTPRCSVSRPNITHRRHWRQRKRRRRRRRQLGMAQSSAVSTNAQQHTCSATTHLQAGMRLRRQLNCCQLGKPRHLQGVRERRQRNGCDGSSSNVVCGETHVDGVGNRAAGIQGRDRKIDRTCTEKERETSSKCSLLSGSKRRNVREANKHESANGSR